MKLMGRIREITNPITGLPEWSRYPATREEAVFEDVAKYIPAESCPAHGRSVYFTITGLAACCAHREAVNAYNDALALGEPTSIHAAQAQGKTYIWTPQVNPLCGHPGKITFAGKCLICSEARANSPRQQALRSGALWYTPGAEDPCSRGHVALRRVANGSCKQCEEENRKESEVSVEQPVYKACPEMVISKNNARALGFKVYRTGRPCSKGHTGWRYISTGGCLTCMGR